MPALLTAIVQGKDADLWILIGLILFAVAAVISVSDKAWTFALVCAGLAFTALGLLVT